MSPILYRCIVLDQNLINMYQYLIISDSKSIANIASFSNQLRVSRIKENDVYPFQERSSSADQLRAKFPRPLRFNPNLFQFYPQSNMQNQSMFNDPEVKFKTSDLIFSQFCHNPLFYDFRWLYPRIYQHLIVYKMLHLTL